MRNPQSPEDSGNIVPRHRRKQIAELTRMFGDPEATPVSTEPATPCESLRQTRIRVPRVLAKQSQHNIQYLSRLLGKWESLSWTELETFERWLDQAAAGDPTVPLLTAEEQEWLTLGRSLPRDARGVLLTLLRPRGNDGGAQ
jgi:hypothetical protein